LSDAPDDTFGGGTRVKPQRIEVDKREWAGARLHQVCARRAIADSLYNQLASVFISKTLSFQRLKFVKPNIFVRNARTGEALYFVQVPPSTYLAGYTLY
jgi:hypothetical protein